MNIRTCVGDATNSIINKSALHLSEPQNSDCCHVFTRTLEHDEITCQIKTDAPSNASNWEADHLNEVKNEGRMKPRNEAPNNNDYNVMKRDANTKLLSLVSTENAGLGYTTRLLP